MLRLLAFLTACAASLAAHATPPGITRTQLLDNTSVLVARLHMEPGAREDLHTHPFSAVVVQMGAGDVEMRIGTRRETAPREAGHVEFLAAEIPHAAANVGSAPFEVVTVALKPDRRRGGVQLPSEAPPGIARNPLLDNTEARATHVTFAPGAREPVHSHPYDLVLVQLTPGRMEVRLGDDTTVKDYAAGDVIFLPRDVPHAAASADQYPFSIVSVGIK